MVLPRAGRRRTARRSTSFTTPPPAVDLVARPRRERRAAARQRWTVVVDHVIVTSGHTANQQAGETRGTLDPYPVGPTSTRSRRTATVAVAGMGLVALDVVTALTVGRGGRFVESGSGLRYLPSGREPARTAVLPQRTAVHRQVGHREGPQRRLQAAHLHRRGSGRAERELDGRRRLVDVRRELLPLLFAEMYARYYAQVAFQASGSVADGAAVRERLARGLDRGPLRGRAARVWPIGTAASMREALFFGHQPRYGCERRLRAASCISRSPTISARREVPDGASPVKSAAEVFRIFRDTMRSVVEQGGLSLDSYLDFNADICSRIHRLVAGPPALRTRQLLALMDAGWCGCPTVPRRPEAWPWTDADPAAGRTASRRPRSSSPMRENVDVVIRGHLDEPRIAGSASQLLTQLYSRGRVSQFRYGEVTVGSVDLTPDSHPIDIEGRPQPSISMFGVLTEGVRHFTHTSLAAQPDPRLRGLGACVAEILGEDSLAKPSQLA